MNQSQSKISFHDVSKSFSNSGLILNNISLTIDEGDFIVILGRSGSGKSTLLRMMAELDRPTAGKLSFHNTRNYDRSFVFQESHLMPWRNVLENVELPLELMKMPPELRKKKALAALEMVQLPHASSLLPSELSGGMKMRVSLARALASEPGLLLLDEPFAALDEQTRFQLAEDLRELWLRKKMTTVFVTHSVQEACFLANRILILSQSPSTVQHDICINLPEKRTHSLRTENAFNEQLKRVYSLIDNNEGPTA
jgi:NitT/TauT family transport system ATP-binding protein